MFRGSLPIVAHLSNLLNNGPMSIISFQVKDGNDDKPNFILNTIKQDVSVVVIDYIFRTSKTFRGIQQMMKIYNNVKYHSSFGKQNDDSIEYIQEHRGRWILFPWNTSKKDLTR